MLRFVWSSGGIDSEIVAGSLKSRYNNIERCNFENQLVSSANLFYQITTLTNLRIILFQDRLIKLIYKRNSRDRGKERMPCLMCNANVKMPLGYLIQDIAGCRSYSGHYIRKAAWPNNILNSLFLSKSQQYFGLLLFHRAWNFPLGFVKKADLRLMCRYLTSNLKESMNTCYLKYPFKTEGVNGSGCIIQDNKLYHDWASRSSIKHISSILNIKYVTTTSSTKLIYCLLKKSKWGITWKQAKSIRTDQISDLIEHSNLNTTTYRKNHIVVNNLRQHARLIKSNR
ncbi:tRNA-specific 2-thiouridylase [Candidatus Hodgkinia cicadicola]|uniref:tRNA-specific 2-thiouridylase n=1 Tax=Candidatus Hodgkinia cicadicola TaxID=573658 RepID=A0ABX4MK70_9HYPH|nr:tRNA-specific 2-thiouridylase [Candidatus Hodgkinia cicadicola]